MKLNTVDLTGSNLHYAVAIAIGAAFKPNSIGANHAYLDGKYIGGFVTKIERGVSMPHHVFSPSLMGAYGAGIGESLLEEQLESLTRTDNGWYAVSKGENKAVAHGESMRLAGLRAIVCAKIGNTIVMPDWLD